MKKTYFSKYEVNFWLERGYMERDLNMYFPPDEKKIEELNVESFFYGYFKNWSNHSNFYYASENTGFKPNTKRTEGTYTKYSSIDDRIDPFHHYFALLKFGHGRCTSNAAREVREGFITREEAISLVEQFDNEFPEASFQDFLKFTNLSIEEYSEIEDKWRNKKLWIKKGNKWEKKYPVK